MFLDQRQMGRQMFAAVEIEQGDVTVSGHETGARRVVRDPQLHVGGIGGVTDVKRVEQHDAAVIIFLQFLNQALQAKFAHRIEMRKF